LPACCFFCEPWHVAHCVNWPVWPVWCGLAPGWNADVLVEWQERQSALDPRWGLVPCVNDVT